MVWVEHLVAVTNHELVLYLVHENAGCERHIIFSKQERSFHRHTKLQVAKLDVAVSLTSTKLFSCKCKATLIDRVRTVISCLPLLYNDMPRLLTMNTPWTRGGLLYKTTSHAWHQVSQQLPNYDLTWPCTFKPNVVCSTFMLQDRYCFEGLLWLSWLYLQRAPWSCRSSFYCKCCHDIVYIPPSQAASLLCHVTLPVNAQGVWSGAMNALSQWKHTHYMLFLRDLPTVRATFAADIVLLWFSFPGSASPPFNLHVRGYTKHARIGRFDDVFMQFFPAWFALAFSPGPSQLWLASAV